MDREFLDHYNSELRLLYENAKDFAEEYPGIAERLGGLVAERMDPMVGGLLEGAAFLAARVQLKIKHEFPEFCINLLEQLAPNYLAPTPATLLAQVSPPSGDTSLREGRKIARGSYLDASYREFDRSGANAQDGPKNPAMRGGKQVNCRFRLTSDIMLWPFTITEARYDQTPAQVIAMGVDTQKDFLASLRVTLAMGEALSEEDMRKAASQPEKCFKDCSVDDLAIFLTGGEADAIALYEQIFAHCIGVYLRYEDAAGHSITLPLGSDCLEQIGFDENEALFPKDNRLFFGFDLLREYFVAPRKFLGFRLRGLRSTLGAIPAQSADFIFIFNEIDAKLSAAATVDMFSLYTAPAVNLFEKTLDRITVKRNQNEYHAIPDRSRPLEFEPHRILEVFAHYRGAREKTPISRLYSTGQVDAGRSGVHYTARRLRRRRTVEEQRQGMTPNYMGVDMFLSLVEPVSLADDTGVAELSARALCSNRHLTEHLPVGANGADFKLVDQTELTIRCVGAPTPPRESIVKYLRSRSETAGGGAIAWRLINLLNLNHLGLTDRNAGENAQALRETLSMFADLSDSAIERRIRGVRSIDSRPIVRRLRRADGVGIARGVEITVTLDENAFEGSGAFLLGAVLDRFFSEYASINHFTQTVVRSLGRGELVRWPPRSGARRLL
jgi:type VI secretion system protein ImpG